MAYLQAEDRKNIQFYFGVFCISGILMALQIMQSRIFSVTTWYHLSFLVVSIAMFGMTMGALRIYRGDEAEQRKNYADLMAMTSKKFSFFIIIALAAQLCIPIIIDSTIGFLLTLPLMAALTVGAYYHAGLCLSLAITRSPFPVPKTYGIDLAGAAAGCLGAVIMMNMMAAPTAVMILSLLALGTARCFISQQPAPQIDTQKKRRTEAFFCVVLVLIIANLMMPKYLVYPLWVKNLQLDQTSISHDQWNAISRVTVSTEYKDIPPLLWGGSPHFPKDITTSFYLLRIDGDAATPIHKFNAASSNLDFLDYDVTTIAYSGPQLESAAIIGVGGGRDVLSAHHAGIPSITALDINSIQIDLLTKTEPYKSYSGLYDLKGLTLINSEARSWFSHTPQTFDIIQMSLIDTWAATSAGAFALSENALYTVEGWETFFKRINPHGILTVSRWYFDDARSETERVLSLAVSTLINLGEENPAAHIYMATSGQIATFVVGRDPLTSAQLDAYDNRAKKMGFTVQISPLLKIEDATISSILHAKTQEEIQKISDLSALNISPATDNTPFFFSQVRLTDPEQVLEMSRDTHHVAQQGHARAILNLYLILGLSFLMVGSVILYPLRSSLRHGTPRLICAGTIWFLLIGIGFMFLEMAMMQKMSLYLGHPAFGLGVVLFSLILATGIGSLISGKIPLSTLPRRLVWIAATATLIAASIPLSDASFEYFADAGLAVRTSLCVALMAPIGVLLGFGFPAGMELVRRGDSRMTVWFWGINGAAGVLGSAVAIALNIGFGLSFTITAAAACYAALAIPAILLTEPRKQNATA